MKIRTDFVTNSSSSSFITIIAYMKDGTVIESQTSMDDIGHGMENPCTFAYVSDQDMLALLNQVNNGTELIQSIDRHYCQMFRISQPNPEMKGTWQYSLYEKANHDGIAAIDDFQQVEEIMITDNWSGDYGTRCRYFIYVPSQKALKSQQVLSETPAKKGSTIHIKVRFEGKREYSYLCPFRVKVGDKVLVEGAKEGTPGVVTRIMEEYPVGKAAATVLNVKKAFNIETVVE